MVLCTSPNVGWYLYICMKFQEDISNGLKLQSGHNFVLETATHYVQRGKTKKYINKSYGSCILHVVIWCLIFVWSFMKISWKALKL